jgi:hypothetical protein
MPCSALAQSADFDLATLDINVGGHELALVFASGYGSGGLSEPFRGHLVLRKPFLIEQLRQAIDAT